MIGTSPKALQLYSNLLGEVNKRYVFVEGLIEEFARDFGPEVDEVTRARLECLEKRQPASVKAATKLVDVVKEVTCDIIRRSLSVPRAENVEKLVISSRLGKALEVYYYAYDIK